MMTIPEPKSPNYEIIMGICRRIANGEKKEFTINDIVEISSRQGIDKFIVNNCIKTYMLKHKLIEPVSFEGRRVTYKFSTPDTAKKVQVKEPIKISPPVLKKKAEPHPHSKTKREIIGDIIKSLEQLKELL